MRRWKIDIAAVASWENLRVACFMAASGMRKKKDTQSFFRHLDANLEKLQLELISGRYEPQEPRVFTIREPKVRVIHAPTFRDRVAQQAIMRKVEPYMEKYLIPDSYACRKNKGTRGALDRAVVFASQFNWFARFDMRQYFNSIPHVRLIQRLRRHIHNQDVVGLLIRIISGYEHCSGKGLPVGSLLSQHIGNFYLAPLDRYICEHSSVGAYLRYMDDGLIFAKSRDELAHLCRSLPQWTQDNLGLQMKYAPWWNQSKMGIPFLGSVISPRGRRLSSRRKRKIRKQIIKINRSLQSGALSELECQIRLQSIVGSARLQGARKIWTTVEQPRASRRQRQQQCQQRTLREPQQQQSGERQHQLWFSLGPSSDVKTGVDAPAWEPTVSPNSDNLPEETQNTSGDAGRLKSDGFTGKLYKTERPQAHEC